MLHIFPSLFLFARSVMRCCHQNSSSVLKRFVYVLITRRGEILVTRDEFGNYELPGQEASVDENLPSVVSQIANRLTKSDACSVGAAIPLQTAGQESLCFPILTQRSSFENWVSREETLVWIARSECALLSEKCGKALVALSAQFPTDAGNTYAIGETSAGIPTFFHLATGETLHGQVGPWEEAQKLYIPLSGLEKREGRAVVHDLGLGCGTLALAALDSFFRNSGLSHLEILSYDLELHGVTALLEHKDRFPYAAPFFAALNDLVANGVTRLRAPDGRDAVWRFVPGDFVLTSAVVLPREQKADVIFFDFFSPKSLPKLWTYDVFRNIFGNSSEEAILITSSSATSTRAALAAAGFYVGLAPASGKRQHSTVASKQLCHLESPLPASWKQTFLRSHVPFCGAEDADSQMVIRQKIESHPQFDSRFS
jgi:tRNA U34 5-methylaminomethyl-2-thiouridine-forming methyltransferase MnmC